MHLEEDNFKIVKDFLQKNDIKYILHKHPPVFTCEEAEKYCRNIPGMSCKNLFLWDKSNKRYFLVILPANKKLNFVNFAEQMETKKVAFANDKILEEMLQLPRGSVSVFGILNDQKKQVELCIDKEVYEANIVSFHPNVNTSTVELSREMFHKFLSAINRDFKTLNLNS